MKFLEKFQINRNIDASNKTYCANYETSSDKSMSEHLKNFICTGSNILVLLIASSFSCFPPNLLPWPDLSSNPASDPLRQQCII